MLIVPAFPSPEASVDPVAHFLPEHDCCLPHYVRDYVSQRYGAAPALPQVQPGWGEDKQPSHAFNHYLRPPLYWLRKCGYIFTKGNVDFGASTDPGLDRSIGS